MLHKKLSYEQVKQFIEIDSNSGCKLLSKFYIKSKDKIDLKCACGNDFTTSFDKFKSLNKRRCNECSRKNVSQKFSKTHEQFLIEVYQLVEDEYIVKEKYINASIPIKIIHNKNDCMNEWRVRPNDFLQGQRCPKCQHRSYKKTTEEFKQEIYNLVGNDIEVLDEYINAFTEIRFKHIICDTTWKTTPHNLLSSTYKCPNCMPNKKLTHEDFCNKVYDLVKDEYLIIEEYKNCDISILFKHNKCGNEHKIIPYYFLRGQRCPTCSNSKGENTIKSILDYNNIIYQQEYRFNDCKYKNTLPFDFAIFEDKEKTKLKCLIEYDGAQHFYVTKRFGGNDTFEIQQKRDAIKNEYCKNNNINLIRIPYWDFKNIEEILVNKLVI